LRELVDVIVGAGLRDLRHSTLDLEVAIGVVRILNGKRDVRVAPEVLVLDATARGVDADVRAVVVDPDGGHLGAPIRHNRGHVGEGPLLEEIEALLRDFGRHEFLLRDRVEPKSEARPVSCAVRSLLEDNG
jgi:hypothetical protein